MYQLLSSTTIVCLVSCGFLNIIGWLLLRRKSVATPDMRHLGFRRLLLPVVDQEAASISPKIKMITQMQRGMVCAYILLILIGWGVFHTSVGRYYLQLAHYLRDLFPGLI